MWLIFYNFVFYFSLIILYLKGFFWVKGFFYIEEGSIVGMFEISLFVDFGFLLIGGIGFF